MKPIAIVWVRNDLRPSLGGVGRGSRVGVPLITGGGREE